MAAKKHSARERDCGVCKRPKTGIFRPIQIGGVLVSACFECSDAWRIEKEKLWESFRAKMRVEP